MNQAPQLTDLVFAKFPKKDKIFDEGTGFIASTDKNIVLDWDPSKETDENEDDKSSSKQESTDNLSTINEEIFNILISYYDFIPILMGFVGLFPKIIIDNEIRTIFEKEGKLIAEDETHICYSAPSSKIREINKSGKKIDSLKKISPIISKFYILGLISQYDSFIYRVSKIIIEKKPNIVFNKETSVSYSELEKHDSVSDIRNMDTSIYQSVPA